MTSQKKNIANVPFSANFSDENLYPICLNIKLIKFEDYHTNISNYYL